MALINQWEDVTTIQCDNTTNTTCFRNGNDVLNYYSFSKVCRRKKNVFFEI
jgi:hypothetical protein